MKKSVIILSGVALALMIAPPSFATSLLDQMKKDWDTLTNGVQQGIEGLKGKPDVEEPGKAAGELHDEPRYDAAWVAEVQQRLTAAGLNPGPIDGAFGKKTAVAIVAFQRSAGLAADGLPRPSMMRSLRARTQTMMAGATPQTDQPTAAPGGGPLAGPPASPAWPAPEAPATGGGLVAPAPPGPAALDAGPGAAAPSEGAGGGLVAPAPGEAPAAPPAAPGQAALADAANPASPRNAALFQQFGLRTLGGRPVVSDWVANTDVAITVAQKEALQRFFDLALLGLNPDAADGQPQSPQRALCLANRYLSDAQKDQVLGPLSPDLVVQGMRNWKGTGHNELEADRSRQSFLDSYLPQIVAAAPQFPIEFVFIGAVQLLKYDTARGGFPIRSLSLALPAAPCFGGRIDFLPPATELPTFWQIDKQTAEQQVINRLPPLHGSAMLERRAFAGIVFSVAPAAAAGGAGLTPIKVAIHSVAIYEDPDLERLLHAFSLDIPAPSVLLTGIPQPVPAADQVLLDKDSAALLLLKNRGDVLGAGAWNRLAAQQLSDDQAYYDKKDTRTIAGRSFSRRRQTFDPHYVPFFPAGFRAGSGGSLTPDQLARFKQWTLARAHVLPDRLVLRGEVLPDAGTGKASLRLGAGGESRGQSTKEPAIATLVKQGYAPGQVVLPDLNLTGVSLDTSTDWFNGERNGRTLALVLPNLFKQYAPQATMEEIGRAWGLARNEGKQRFDVEMTFDLERVDLMPIDPAPSRPGLASEVVTLFGRPVSLRYFDRNGDYAALQQTFEVAALNPHQVVAPTTAAPVPDYADRAPFTAEVADLLIAKYLPDALTEAELDRMLLARWHYETDFNKRVEEPLGGRFFVEGAPKPGARERASLLARFRDWTLSRAKAMPATVTLRLSGGTSKPGPLRLGTPVGGSPVADVAQSCQSRVASAQREHAGISSTETLTLAQACRFLEQATKLTAPEIYLGALDSQALRSGGSETNRLLGPRSQCGAATGGPDGYCAGMQQELKGELLGADIVLNDVPVIDKEIVVPDDPRLNQHQRSTKIEVDLRIVGIRRATGLPPHPAQAALERYEAFAAEHGLPSLWKARREGTPQLKLYLFDAQVVEARVVDDRSQEVVGTLELRDREGLDTDLLKVIEPGLVAAAPAPYGPDIVGLRLGMSFAAADKIIRDHMPVGRMLVADRAYQTDAATGGLKPFSSGRLYVSKDGSDTIILFDESPAAPDVVMSVVRQVDLPKGRISAAEVFAQLRNKYGKEKDAGNDQLAWGEGGTANGDFKRCAPDLRRQGHLDIWRQPDGTPVDWRAQGAGSPGFALPSIYPVDENEARFAKGCHEALGARLETNGREADHLIMGIIDKPAYALQFAQSKQLIAKGEAPTKAAQTSPDLKL